MHSKDTPVIRAAGAGRFTPQMTNLLDELDKNVERFDLSRKHGSVLMLPFVMPRRGPAPDYRMVSVETISAIIAEINNKMKSALNQPFRFVSFRFALLRLHLRSVSLVQMYTRTVSPCKLSVPQGAVTRVKFCSSSEYDRCVYLLLRIWRKLLVEPNE